MGRVNALLQAELFACQLKCRVIPCSLNTELWHTQDAQPSLLFSMACLTGHSRCVLPSQIAKALHSPLKRRSHSGVSHPHGPPIPLSDLLQQCTMQGMQNSWHERRGCPIEWYITMQYPQTPSYSLTVRASCGEKNMV